MPTLASGTPESVLRALFVATLAVMLSSGGCESEERPLQLADLTSGEELYLTRLISLERAKTAAFVDREAGDALLDSLAAAWGDTALAATREGAPWSATRARAVSELYSRVLAAEHEALLESGGFERIGAPLIDPPPPPPTEPES